MHPHLTRLGIRPEVQSFFGPYYETDENGDLCFGYGESVEHFGFGFHYIPVSNRCWMAGNLCLSQVRQVIISGSALDAVSWLNKKAPFFTSFQNMLFISTGPGIKADHIRWINAHLKHKEYFFIYGNDLLARIAGLKLAAALRNQSVEIYVEPGERIAVCFRAGIFYFSQDRFSLSAFEKAAKFRFNIRCDKPKTHLTFFDELKADALFTF